MIAAIGELQQREFINLPVSVGAFWIALWIAVMAQVKRWHDMDRTGLWCLVNLIPFFGNLYALVELGFERGTKGSNEFGNDPFEN
ncbi:MAG: DUF805 domain-containing protein [Planctomycetota bacterium]